MTFAAPRVTSAQFFAHLRWLDGAPLLTRMEPYRLAIFEQAFDTFDEAGRLRYNLIVCGRAKKNWKSADLVLACFLALLLDSPGGNQVYLVANDEGQAADDLTIGKKLIKANPELEDWVRVKANLIERKDDTGFIEILPAQDAIGAHGKTYRLLAVDEIHGYRNYDLLEALAPDPTRADTQQWITSYASIHHRPGVPLFDLCQTGRARSDPRMLFSWYAADYATDPRLDDATPEERANPSRGTWQPGYLEQQLRRLPAHKYRRLHLNLPGLPDGSAFQPEPIMNAVQRGVPVRLPEAHISYRAFVDMSGGSSDAATLAIAHADGDGQIIIDRVLDQGQAPPFDPRKAVARFAGVLKDYRISRVVGDRYAGVTFIADFQSHEITYSVSDKSKSELYGDFEPLLNAGRVVLPDVPTLEQQLLGLVWRGGKIDHPSGEHDDLANAAVGAADLVANGHGHWSAKDIAELLAINDRAIRDDQFSFNKVL